MSAGDKSGPGRDAAGRGKGRETICKKMAKMSRSQEQMVAESTYLENRRYSGEKLRHAKLAFEKISQIEKNYLAILGR